MHTNEAFTNWYCFQVYFSLPVFLSLQTPIKSYFQPNIHCVAPVIVQTTLN